MSAPRRPPQMRIAACWQARQCDRGVRRRRRRHAGARTAPTHADPARCPAAVPAPGSRISAAAACRWRPRGSRHAALYAQKLWTTLCMGWDERPQVRSGRTDSGFGHNFTFVNRSPRRALLDRMRLSARSVACLLLLACRRCSGPLLTLRWDDGAQASVEEPILEQARALDRFLASIEKRAFRMARIALRHDEDALDSVQDAMLQLARRYGRRPSEEWRPLFYRILQNRIRDCQRRRRVQARIMAWLPGLKSQDDAAPRMNTRQCPTARRCRRSSWPRTRRCRRSSDRWRSCRAGSRKRSCCGHSRAWTSRRPRPRWDAAKAASRHTTRGPCIRCASSWELRGERRV